MNEFYKKLFTGAQRHQIILYEEMFMLITLNSLNIKT